ncbi:hypothetical protein [Thermoplasma volcanium GSS1]|uniref:Phosphoribosylformylglycinamidine synthase subunit PurS n=1 Tax=Thermoplasma volcanium (strain ATCC 51530 / DSM 4299 / JCM 9571 / NBRC 15438 / GSS1) TaxID=273116 RepID=Q97BA6_THEVO|nr:phosphoribosylformylglycinamidine synthase subunit PurS [Thermoplasma volcanium]BAB59693.1 hypothetical protein [Thermoplasma volcanium GSS1]
MKFKVEVSYKPGVEDPEALTLLKNLNILGYHEISNVSISKVYYFDAGNEEEVKQVADKILSNPVIHSYKVEKLG